jgi:DNA modification methylase
VTPYYSHGGIQIFLGDCREVLPTLGRFDLLLTDPPYGTGVDTRNEIRGRGERKNNAKGPCRAVNWRPVTGDDAPFDPASILRVAPNAILWGANNYASRLPDSPCWLAWDRKCDRAGDSNATDAELAAVIGHRFQTVRVFRHMWIGFQRDSENAQGQLHPMQKPVALMRWCLGFFPEAKTVVDPYMGSGPVARACKDAGLTYVGIEIEERYAEIAAKRLAQEVLFA